MPLLKRIPFREFPIYLLANIYHCDTKWNKNKFLFKLFDYLYIFLIIKKTLFKLNQNLNYSTYELIFISGSFHMHIFEDTVLILKEACGVSLRLQLAYSED